MTDIGGTWSSPATINPIGSVFRDTIGGTDSADTLRFTAPFSGTLTVTMNGLTADIDMELYRGSTLLNYSENWFTANEIIIHQVTAGTTYFVYIYPYDTGVTQYNLSVALDATAPSGTSAVFRFRNETTGSYFYTSNSSERNNIMLTAPTLMYEGPAFYVPTTATGDTTQVHRFFNTQTQTHFFTASAQERTQIQSTLPHFRYEGVAFTAFTRDLGPQEEVYRFLNTQTGTHLYTSSEQERAAILAGQPHLVLEGIAYWTA